MRQPITIIVTLLVLLILSGLLSVTSSDSVLAQAYETPHGPYGAFPVGCAACHVAHASLGPQLIMKANVTTLCLTCHDGTASVFNVVYVPEVDIYGTGVTRAVYGFGFGTTSGAVYFHPVKNTGNPAVGEIIECTYCHNPHASNPRLLQSTVTGATYTQGPAYCLACHGAVDRGFPSVEDPAVSYWVYTLGDHTNSKAAHYDTTKTALQPASGTYVTCATCHYKHASDLRRLLAGAEENLCFKCHNTTANSMSGRNIEAEFQKASRHDIFGTTGAKVECSSCHGPHTVGAKSLSVSDTTYSQVSNPDNTKSVMARVSATQDNGIANTVGTFTDFCLKCHDGSPPTATESTTTFVPYTVIFPNTNFTTNTGGWNKSAYIGKGHDTRTILCTDCHQSHGSDYPLLQKYAEDTDTISGECLRCHDGSYTGAANVKTDLTGASRHPTLYVSGKHSNTENYNNLPLADRHAECADCHDPHRCDSTTATAPAPYGSIKGVSGVSIDYGTSSWSDWPTGATFTFKLGIDYQYELCFKCHSYYSYGSSPPSGYTDQAKEFNPNNVGYHAVVGESKIPKFDSNGDGVPDTYYGKFVPPWTATSRLYCTDCHASSVAGVRGPHGSANPFILERPWIWDTNRTDATGKPGTQNHLCFKCHDYNFYAYTDGGSATVRSQFSDSSTYNRHITGQHEVKGCASCHGRIPHGWRHWTDPTDNVTHYGSLVEWNQGAPYWDGSWLDINVWREPGTWDNKYCNHGALPSGGNPNSGKDNC